MSWKSLMVMFVTGLVAFHIFLGPKVFGILFGALMGGPIHLEPVSTSSDFDN